MYFGQLFRGGGIDPNFCGESPKKKLNLDKYLTVLQFISADENRDCDGLMGIIRYASRPNVTA